LIKVSNTVKFQNFAQSIVNWENKNGGFTAKYKSLLNSGDNTKNLKEFMKMLGDTSGGMLGLSLYAAFPNSSGGYDFDKWQKVGWDGFDLSFTNCY
jgi:hypothetical protein